MITEPTIKVALACLVLLSVCLPGCNSSPSSPSMTGLPRIDKAELFQLKNHGDLWNGEFERETSLVGNEAQDVARLWRAQSFSSDSPISHNPGYAIFASRNVKFSEPLKDTHDGLRGFELKDAVLRLVSM